MGNSGSTVNPPAQPSGGGGGGGQMGNQGQTTGFGTTIAQQGASATQTDSKSNVSGTIASTSTSNGGVSNQQFSPIINVTPNIVLNTNSRDVGGFSTSGPTSAPTFDPMTSFSEDFAIGNSARPAGSASSVIASLAGPIGSAVGGYAAGYMLGVNPTISAGLSAASFYAGEFVSPGQDLYSTGIRVGVGTAATVGGLVVTSAPIDLSLAVGGLSSAAGEAAIRIFNRG